VLYASRHVLRILLASCLTCILAASIAKSCCGYEQSPASSSSGSGDTSSPTGEVIDLAAYESALQSYSNTIEQNRHKQEEIARLRKSIPEHWTLRTSAGDVNVSNEWLRTELWNLEHHPKDADVIAVALKQRLYAIRVGAVQMETRPPEPEQARARLGAILSRREFRDLAGPSAAQKLMARISRWLLRQVVWLLSRLHINAKAGNVLAWTVIVVAFALLCYWMWKRLRSGAPLAQCSITKQETATMTSRQWLDEAMAAAERHDYREAIHCAYWAAIARLEDSGVLTRDRSRTPRESIRQLDSRPNDQKPLRDLTRHFELIWYGYRLASADDWCGARAQLEQMGCLKVSTAPTANS